MATSPTHPLQIARQEIKDLTETVQGDFGSLTKEQLNWQLSNKTWTIAQCLDHIIKANKAYFPAFRRALENGPTATGQSGFRNSLLGSLFIRLMSPSFKFKIPAPSAIRPKQEEFDATIIDTFVAHQNDILRFIDEASQYDLSKTIVTSPFSRLISFKLGEVFHIMVMHEQRHIEQAKRVLQADEFPDG